MPGAGPSPAPYHSDTGNGGEAAGMVGKRKPWLFLLLSGNETVTMWVKGICSGATDSDLGHRQTCT